MATVPFFVQQFTRLNGEWASGAKLYAFQQGTNTPAFLYLDAALTTPAPAPLILLSGGIVPQFWVPLTPGLKFVLRDTDDTLIWTRDYISPTASSGGGGGSVSSVGITLGPALEAIASVSNSPITSAGVIQIELDSQAQGLALMSPAGAAGVPSFRQIQASDVAGGPFLPTAGGTMDLNAQISWPDESEYSAGMYFGSALGNWTQINRRQIYYAESATRSGFYIIPTTNPTNGGTTLSLTRSGRQDVSIYAHADGGYASFYDKFKRIGAAIGARPSSGGGEIQIRDAAGQSSFYHYGDAGETWTAAQEYQWSGEPACSKVSAIAYADAAITTTAERSIISADGAAPFESLYVRAKRLSSQGVGLKLEAMGIISSGANQTLTLRTYRDGTLVGTITVTAQNFGTNTPWRFVLKVRPTGDGLRVIGRFYYTASNANFGVSCQAFTALVAAFDNDAHTYDVTAQWGVAGNSMSTQDWEAWA